MRYLLLSVLVVCVIGVMIPSVIGQSDLFGEMNDSDYDPLYTDEQAKYFNSYFFKGYVLSDIDIDAALVYFEKSIEIGEDLGAETLYKELSDEKQGWENQIAELDEKINKNPNNDRTKAEDLVEKVLALNKLGAWSRADEVASASEELFYMSGDTGGRADIAFGEIVKALSKKGDWKKVLEWREQYPHLSLRASDYYSDTRGTDFGLIRAYYNVGEYDVALRIIDNRLLFENDMTKRNLLYYKATILDKIGELKKGDVAPGREYVISIYESFYDWSQVIYHIEEMEKENAPLSSSMLTIKVIANHFLEQQSPTKQIEDVFTSIFEEPKSSGGCGPGTVLVNGVCQLAPTQSITSFMSIEPIYLIIGAVGIGGVIAGVIAVAKRGSKTPRPAKQELDEYEEQYLAKEKPVKQKPVEKKETSAFCENCGNTLNPKAKFCGGCGTPVS